MHGGGAGRRGGNGKNTVSLERVRQRREKGSERTGNKRRTEGGMHAEVDGWMVHGKQRESRAE